MGAAESFIPAFILHSLIPSFPPSFVNVYQDPLISLGKCIIVMSSDDEDDNNFENPLSVFKY